MKHDFVSIWLFKDWPPFFNCKWIRTLSYWRHWLILYVKRRAIIRNISETVIYRKKKKEETIVLNMLMFQMRDSFLYKTIHSASNKQCREQSKLMLLANQNRCCLLIKIKSAFSERQVVFLQKQSRLLLKTISCHNDFLTLEKLQKQTYPFFKTWCFSSAL